ncbi:hypothetical protein A2415_00110 [candidate division WWE3 bacterium RIFOXYC1_FULL_39_7]|uniref:Uncharacterized protein n=1 Tax=candidate division WWE3 bacterium RIFOXYC1_FULL_39_7 TaxID=1802643 RepID=A0A1F4WKF3_UNCKA|nr:MAG: hypothetical protein A2415_00110 [candidate division WWE3 bacterium RIFOXYC1_FULL_39_7]
MKRFIAGTIVVCLMFAMLIASAAVLLSPEAPTEPEAVKLVNTVLPLALAGLIVGIGLMIWGRPKIIDEF